MSIEISAPVIDNATPWRGMRVGVFGGSFNPPHIGHLHIAKAALERFELDAVWWVVSSGNPLKESGARDDVAHRMGLVEAMIAGQPKMVASDIESQMGTRFAIDTVLGLQRHFEDTEFVWIAGMDNAAQFHLWQDWQKLPNLMPFAFFDRPPVHTKDACNVLREYQGFEHHQQYDGNLRKGVYWVMDAGLVDMSSSALRQREQ